MSARGAAPVPRRLPAIPFFVAASLATIALWTVSRGKWSDAIIDSGREWIVPDALSRGELLYRDVVYWVGPLTPYLHAGWLRLFGSSFATLAVAGTVESLAMLIALFLAVRLVAGCLQAALWTALAIPVIVFMPNSGGVLIGLGYRHAATFSLLALTLLCRRGGNRRNATLAVAGALCGLAGLCRTEWGMASLAAGGLGVAVQDRFRVGALRRMLVLGSAALLTFGAVIAAFVAAAGFGPVIVEGHLLLTGLPEETRRFVVAFSGIRDWRRGIPNVFYSATLWLGLFLLVRLLAERRSNAARSKNRLVGLLVVLLLLGLFAILGGSSGAFLWSGAPALCLFSAVLGVSRPGRKSSTALAAFGSMGLLMSHRRIFHIGDSWYVGTPLLFAFVCASALLRLAMASDREREPRIRLQGAVALTLGGLVVLAFAMRFVQYGNDPRVAIAGTEGMLSARPEIASQIESLAREIRREERGGGGLAVFPEGEILNYLSGSPNPCRHKMYLPGYLTRANEAEVLKELERARPRAVVLWRRLTSEYGPALFGEDYGQNIRAWLDANYQRRAASGGRYPEMVLYLARRPR